MLVERLDQTHRPPELLKGKADPKFNRRVSRRKQVNIALLILMEKINEPGSSYLAQAKWPPILQDDLASVDPSFRPPDQDGAVTNSVV
jgi:hypothetical protein